MSRPLTVRNAELRTVTVEIQTLTVSRKQVTLAVFRQLEEKQLIDPKDQGLNGLPWGRVNYHPDNCRDDDHIHVIWQEGSELRRAKVDEPSRPSEDIHIIPGVLNEYARAWFCHSGHDYAEYSKSGFKLDHVADSVSYEIHGLDVTAELPSRPWYGSCDYCGLVYTSNREEREVAEKEARRYAWGEISWAADEIKREKDAEYDRIEAEEAMWERYRKQWEALNDLPQLFIAV